MIPPTLIDWPSFLMGLAVIPALLVVAALVLFIIGILQPSATNTKCDVCDWAFAGLAENYDRHVFPPNPKANKVPVVIAWLSIAWHGNYVSRTKKHRAAWTKSFEAYSPGGSIREMRLKFAKRMGTKGHMHTP